MILGVPEFTVDQSLVITLKAWEENFESNLNPTCSRPSFTKEK
jgi:hypothetical protein